jgi:phosphoenolpyruvate phosphomutase
VEPGIPLDAAQLRHKIRNVVEGYPVHLDIVDSIQQTAAGKHRLVMSQLAAASVAQPVAARAACITDTGGPDEQAADGNGQERANRGNHHDRSAARMAKSVAGISAPTWQHPGRKKSAQLRRLIERPGLDFLMEAHNGLSARVVEEAGFEGIWASGLSISAALGVRDCNEASWTQVLEVLEFMSDSTQIPILLDGDTGYGNFNNMRRLVRKLQQRHIGGVCIEDKIFPKTNSFINGKMQPLADVDEFCGRIKAGKDAQDNDDFVIVARLEAFIAGWGLDEAMKRAIAYHEAGADAILVHSARRSPEEILAFKAEWGDRSPVVIVPTKYYATPTEVFRHHGFSVAIWANHLMRTALTAMQRTALEIFEDQHLMGVEDRVAPLAEVFRIQGAAELAEAERRYLPANAGATQAIVLADRPRTDETEDTREPGPRCMVRVQEQPLLSHVVDNYRAAGVKDIHVVRGPWKDAVQVPGVSYHDSDEARYCGEAHSLYTALSAREGSCIVSFGDVLFKKYVVEELVETKADFAISVDVDWRGNRRRNHRSQPATYVTCSEEDSRRAVCRSVRLLDISSDLIPDEIHGEWMGFLKVSAAGALFLRELLAQRARQGNDPNAMTLADVLSELLQAGQEVHVLYTSGQWSDADSLVTESLEPILAGSATP